MTASNIPQLAVMGLVTVLGLMLLGVGVVLSEPPPPESAVHKGYLVYDEEEHAFYPCGGGEPVSISFSRDTGVGDRYELLKKEIREPIYFEVEGTISDAGQWGYGLAGSNRWDSHLDISQLLTARRIERKICGAVFETPFSWPAEA